MNGDGGTLPGSCEPLTAWARERGVRVRVAAEDWESITYEAIASGPDGPHVVDRVRCALPEAVVRRRMLATYLVGLSHEVDGAQCSHVRRVVPPALFSSDEADRHDVTLVAAALVESERRAVCGATVDNLTVYTVQRAKDWQPF